MNKVLSFISNYFWIFFTLAIVIWVVFPDFSKQSINLLSIFMMAIMYIGCLNIKKDQLIQVWKNWKKVSVYMIVSMFILPILFYYLSNFLFWDWSVWVFLLVAAPAWVASIALTNIVKWNTWLVASITILSSLISVISIPLLSKFILSSEINIDTLKILISLFEWIIIPFSLAQLTQIIYPKYENIKKYISPLTVLLVMPMIWSPIWANIESYKKIWLEVLIYWTLLLFGLSIILHVIWWFLYKSWPKEDKIAWSIWLWYMNISIALLLANNYFWPKAIILILLYELPWDLMLIPFAWISRKIK